METGGETHRLRQEIERALRRVFDPADVIPRLARLARLAPAASDDGVFAHRQLAELLVERHPWRAAIYARRALAHREDDDRGWAVLAFSQTLLGNFRCAATAYEKAIASAPGNPWYAHNLGHLLDVALGAPDRALPWLRSAYGAKGDNSEIVASYVHALARAGHTVEARGVLERALVRFESRELEALLRWLDQGAPSRGTGRSSLGTRRGHPDGVRERPSTTDRRLARVLSRGLAHLPLDSGQRQRALTLARDALADAARLAAHACVVDQLAGVDARIADAATAAPRRTARAATSKGVPAKDVSRKAAGKTAIKTSDARSRETPDLAASLSPKRRPDDVAGLAAAVAYAIVYVDHVPLSQAEVAAPFRVAVARLRGRFAELRAKLDIIPGDARYATIRSC